MTGVFTGEQPGDYMTLESGPRLVISGNGSMLIRAVDSSHEGHYTCQASNGIGSGLSKVIFLRVNGKYVPQTSKTKYLSFLKFLFYCHVLGRHLRPPYVL
jgi:hypothetical protein